MDKLEEVKELLETARFNSRYDNFPLSKEEQAIEYLLSIQAQAENAINKALVGLKIEIQNNRSENAIKLIDLMLEALRNK